MYVFEVTDYEFSIRFYEFKVRDLILLPWSTVAIVFIVFIIPMLYGFIYAKKDVITEKNDEIKNSKEKN